MLPRALMISEACAMQRELQTSITLQCNFAFLKTDKRCGEKNEQNGRNRAEEYLMSRDEKLESLPRTRFFGARCEATLIGSYVGLKFLHTRVAIIRSKCHCLENDVGQRVRHRMTELLP